jgi:transposase InsO family protein
MTDNGSGYQSALFNDWPEAAGIEHKRTGPHGPWQNGRVERMNRTSAQEWRYARAYAIEGGRTAPAAAPRRHASSVKNVMARNNFTLPAAARWRASPDGCAARSLF